MAMTSPLMQKTARQELAEVLVFHRKDRNLSLRRVADMLGCSQARVEQHEAGDLVPNGHDWDKYRAFVDRRLVAYNELRLRALNEREVTQKISTGLKHTPLAALPPIVVTPKPEAVQAAIDAGRTPSSDAMAILVASKPPHPAAGHVEKALSGLQHIDAAIGTEWRNAENRDKRCAAARAMLEEDPDLLTRDVHDRLVKQFGVAINHAEIKSIRHKVKDAARKRAQTEARRLEREAALPEVAARVEVTVTPPAPSPEDNIRTAVELVLEALPNLRTFSISVDDHGEATIDYAMREIRIVENAGSLKMGRKS